MYLVKFKIWLFCIRYVKVSVGSASYNPFMWCFQSSSNILCSKNTLDKFPLRELYRAKLTSVDQVGEFLWSFSKWSNLDPNAGKSRMDTLLNRPSESTSVTLVKIWLNFSSNFVGSLCRGVCGHLLPLIRNPNSCHTWKYVPTHYVFLYTSWEFHTSYSNNDEKTKENQKHKR